MSMQQASIIQLYADLLKSISGFVKVTKALVTLGCARGSWRDMQHFVNNALKLNIRRRFLTISLQIGEARIEKNDIISKHFKKNSKPIFEGLCNVIFIVGKDSTR